MVEKRKVEYVTTITPYRGKNAFPTIAAGKIPLVHPKPYFNKIYAVTGTLKIGSTLEKGSRQYNISYTRARKRRDYEEDNICDQQGFPLSCGIVGAKYIFYREEKIYFDGIVDREVRTLGAEREVLVTLGHCRNYNEMKDRINRGIDKVFITSTMAHSGKYQFVEIERKWPGVKPDKPIKYSLVRWFEDGEYKGEITKVYRRKNGTKRTVTKPTIKRASPSLNAG